MTTNRNADHRATVVDRAAAALRQQLGPCDTARCAVAVDIERGELTIESRAAVIRLDDLIEQVRAAPEHRCQELIDRFIGAALATNSQMQTIRLDDWTTVEPRLRVRLRTKKYSEPNAEPLAARPELEVIIDLPDAVIVPTNRMLAAWNMPLDRVASTALANTRQAAAEPT